MDKKKLKSLEAECRMQRFKVSLDHIEFNEKSHQQGGNTVLPRVPS